jgi:plastocyanin
MRVVGAIVIAGSVVVAAMIAGSQRQEPDGHGASATVILEDHRFVPNRLDATVGVPLRIRVTNAGTERHDMDLSARHMPRLAGVEVILEPGETRTITLLFSEPGTHPFSCTLPGHAAAGMTGAVFVAP